ncbi:MAG: DNA mismatch repair endonuclease MutL, partial [Halobacteriaceae archaeon]
MNSRIHKLDEETIQQIAAGEVVERPASVVKELVENSLDAGATSIDVIVKKGGKETIRVVDNGRGMTAEEVSESVKKHTTSKISSIDDLAEGIQSLGFRGEALHTIAAVSKLTITSAPDNQSRGTKLEIDGGDRVDRHPTGHPQGTTVEVKDLFYNVPARKKYLKSEST